MEEEREKCPECGSETIKIYNNVDLNGKWIEEILECSDCGYTEST